MQHLFATASPGVWIRLLIENGGLAPRYWPKMAGILATGVGLAPLRLVEAVRYGGLVKRTEIAHPPLMVIGHGRSGTTHLQNLLCEDENFGSLTTYQAIFPQCSLIGRGWLEKVVASQMEETRPMDNVAIGPDRPMEEDLAIGRMTSVSTFHAVSFPSRWRAMHDRNEYLEGLTDKQLAEWRRACLHVVRKATIHAGGRRLVLKNTPSLSRIPHLLDLFPGALFVNVVRDPYVMFNSVDNVIRTMTRLMALEDFDESEMNDRIIYTYRKSIQRYLRDRDRIPDGHLFEMKFEDLTADPVGKLREVYDWFGLPGWVAFEKRVRTYLDSLGGYRQNRYELPAETVRLVSEEWGFALEAFGYDYR